MIFIQRARKQLLMDQPGLKVTDVSVELAGRWRAMAAEEKQPYLEEQARLKDAVRRCNTLALRKGKGEKRRRK